MLVNESHILKIVENTAIARVLLIKWKSRLHQIR